MEAKGNTTQPMLSASAGAANLSSQHGSSHYKVSCQLYVET